MVRERTVSDGPRPPPHVGGKFGGRAVVTWRALVSTPASDRRMMVSSDGDVCVEGFGCAGRSSQIVCEDGHNDDHRQALEDDARANGPLRTTLFRVLTFLLRSGVCRISRASPQTGMYTSAFAAS